MLYMYSNETQNGEKTMTTYNVYANGILWGEYEAETPEGAMQAAADEHGTVDVGETKASTDGMTAVPAADDQ